MHLHVRRGPEREESGREGSVGETWSTREPSPSAWPSPIHADDAFPGRDPALDPRDGLSAAGPPPLDGSRGPAADPAAPVARALPDETTPANFRGSFYSRCKADADVALAAAYRDCCLTLRVRMPICADLANERNFVHKISKYAKVINVPNSVTVLPDLLPRIMDVIDSAAPPTGPLNFVSPGALSHAEVLTAARESGAIPDLVWETFTLDEQKAAGVGARSNTELCSRRLRELCPGTLDAGTALRETVFGPWTARRAGG